MDITHSDFFQGLTERGLFYWSNHSGETQLPKQEEEVVAEEIGLFFLLLQCPICLGAKVSTATVGVAGIFETSFCSCKCGIRMPVPSLNFSFGLKVIKRFFCLINIVEN